MEPTEADQSDSDPPPVYPSPGDTMPPTLAPIAAVAPRMPDEPTPVPPSVSPPADETLARLRARAAGACEGISWAWCKQRARVLSAQAAAAADTPLGRRLGTFFARSLMAADMFSDWAVTAHLYRTGHPYFPMSVFLCVLPLIVLTLVLFRPAYRLQARYFAVQAPGASNRDMSSSSHGSPNGDFPRDEALLSAKWLPLSVGAFALCWLVVGPISVILIDASMLTLFLCTDPSRSAQLLFYERLRMLTEVLFESIPQSFFQLSLRETKPLVVGSIFIGWLSLASHVLEMRTEARERKVPLLVHLLDVLSAGFGVLPFIGAIRARRLPAASYSDLPLVNADIATLLAALEDGARNAAEEAAAKSASSHGPSQPRPSYPSADLSANSLTGVNFGGCLVSLDLSNVGLGGDQCQSGVRQVASALAQRRLGPLLHLALDRNELDRADGQLLGEAIAQALCGGTEFSAGNFDVVDGYAFSFARKASERQLSSGGAAKDAPPLLLRTLVVDSRLLDVRALAFGETVDFRFLDALAAVAEQARLAKRAARAARAARLLGEGSPSTGTAMSGAAMGALEAGLGAIKSSSSQVTHAAFAARLVRDRRRFGISADASASRRGACGWCLGTIGCWGGDLGPGISPEPIGGADDDDAEGGWGGWGNSPRVGRSKRRCCRWRLRAAPVMPESQSPTSAALQPDMRPPPMVPKLALGSVGPGAMGGGLSMGGSQHGYAGSGGFAEAWGQAEQALAMALLASNQRLRTLRCAGADLSHHSGDARALAGLLRKLPALDTLDLRLCPIDRLSKRILAEALVAVAEGTPLQTGVLAGRPNNGGDDGRVAMLGPVSESSSDSDDSEDKEKRRRRKASRLAKRVSESAGGGNRSPATVGGSGAAAIRRLREAPGKVGLRFVAVDGWALLPGTSALELDNKRLGDEDCLLLAAALRANSDLVALSMRNNLINAGGERALADVVRHFNRSLVALDLRGNQRPAAGLALTEAALSPGATLATLAGVPVLAIKSGAMVSVDLRSRWLGPEGWAVLVGALEAGRRTALKLDVSDSLNPKPLGGQQEEATSVGGRGGTGYPQGGFGATHSGGGSQQYLTGGGGGGGANGLVSFLSRKSTALMDVCLDGALPMGSGDAFASALVAALPRNRSLTRLSLCRVGLTSVGKGSIAAALVASGAGRAPLSSFACDEWSLDPITTRISLSPAKRPPTSPGDQISSAPSTAQRLYGLHSVDVGLLVAILGSNSKVRTVELDARILEVARPGDLHCLLDPPHGKCNITSLAVAVGGVGGAEGGGGEGGHRAGTPASYYAALVADERARAATNQQCGLASPTHQREGGCETPRDAASSLSALLGSLRSNGSLKSLHLALRPIDAGFGASSLSSAEAGQRFDPYAAPQPSDRSTRSTDRASHSSSSVGATPRTARQQLGVPAWVAALGDGLAFNGSLETLVVRGDGALLAGCAPQLTDALARAQTLACLELHLMGPPGKVPPPTGGAASAGGRDVGYAGGLDPVMAAAWHTPRLRVHTTATSTIITMDSTPRGVSPLKAPKGLLVPDSPGGAGDASVRATDPAALASLARVQWLRVMADVLGPCAVLLSRSKSLVELAVQLCVPGFSFLADREGQGVVADGPRPAARPPRCSDVAFGFGVPQGCNSGPSRRADEQEEGFDDEPYEGPIDFDLTFESAKTALGRAAAPSSHRASHAGVLLRINSPWSEVGWLSEDEARDYMEAMTLLVITQTERQQAEQAELNKGLAGNPELKKKSSSWFGGSKSSGKESDKKPSSITPMTVKDLRKGAAKITGFHGFFGKGKDKKGLTQLQEEVSETKSDGGHGEADGDLSQGESRDGESGSVIAELRAKIAAMEAQGRGQGLGQGLGQGPGPGLWAEAEARPVGQVWAVAQTLGQAAVAQPMMGQAQVSQSSRPRTPPRLAPITNRGSVGGGGGSSDAQSSVHLGDKSKGDKTSIGEPRTKSPAPEPTLQYAAQTEAMASTHASMGRSLTPPATPASKPVRPAAVTVMSSSTESFFELGALTGAEQAATLPVEADRVLADKVDAPKKVPPPLPARPRPTTTEKSRTADL